MKVVAIIENVSFAGNTLVGNPRYNVEFASEVGTTKANANVFGAENPYGVVGKRCEISYEVKRNRYEINEIIPIE